jgi:hypothetical protein
MPAPVVAAADTLTSVARARIVEAAIQYRQMIFLGDTTTLVEGCSATLAVGADYRSLAIPEFRRFVSEPAPVCEPTPPPGKSTRRLIVRTIEGSGRNAVIRMTYDGRGTYIHEEEFKVTKASSRPDGRWVAMEMRIYDAAIAD